MGCFRLDFSYENGVARPSFADLGICGAYLRAPLIKLLVAYESSTQYQLRFDFYGIGERSVRTNIGKEMD